MIFERTKEYYDEQYNNLKRTPRDIADEWDTYPNKIRREIIRYGFKLRSKGEAQSIALGSGRKRHPTEGKKRSDDVKVRISDAMARSWELMSDSEKRDRSILGRQQWDAMSDIDKIVLREMASEAIRESARDGSKLERFLAKALQKEDYDVAFHAEHILPNTRLQTDLYIPSYKTVIEIDGPSHFFPIWGQESLDNNIKADNKKNNLLLTFGFVVIRVRHISSTASGACKRKLLSRVTSILEGIKSDFPEVSKRLIEIEI